MKPPKKSFAKSHIYFMKEALKEALKDQNKAWPNPRVGCVIVKNNQIIAKGYHAYFGGPHAEVMALSRLNKRARGATLYVTLEPCHHFGKTPPCVDAVIQSQVKHVVIALSDPNPKTYLKSISKLKKAKIKVTLGVCETEAYNLNKGFCRWHKTGLPYVVVKVAQTLDGKISAQKNTQTQITGPKSFEYTQKLRSHCDAILVGSQTQKIDNPKLSIRDKNAKQPLRVILDSHLKTSLKARLFQEPKAKVVLCVNKSVSAQKIKKYEKKGAHILICKTSKMGQLDLKDVLKKLGAEFNVYKILVEGGSQVLESLVKEKKLINELHLLTSPTTFKGKGVSLGPKTYVWINQLKPSVKKKLGKDLLECFVMSKLEV